MAAGANGSEYARLLLEMARDAGRDPALGTSVAMARPSQLEGRLLSILNATGAPRRLRLSLPLATLLLLLPTAALEPWRDTAIGEPVEPGALEQTRQQTQLEPPRETPGTPLRELLEPGLEAGIDPDLQGLGPGVGQDTAAPAAADGQSGEAGPQLRVSVRQAMIRALEDKDAAEGLLDVMEHDPEEEIRRAAMQALALILG